MSAREGPRRWARRAPGASSRARAPKKNNRSNKANTWVCVCVCIYIYIYTHMCILCICMYIYIYRERERDRYIHTHDWFVYSAQETTKHVSLRAKSLIPIRMIPWAPPAAPRGGWGALIADKWILCFYWLGNKFNGSTPKVPLWTKTWQIAVTPLVLAPFVPFRGAAGGGRREPRPPPPRRRAAAAPGRRRGAPKCNTI